MEKRLIQPSKTAIVLGGGGCATSFEVGALSFIENNKLPVDKVIGVSGGAIAGSSFLAEDCSAKRLHTVFCALKDPSSIFERESIRHIAMALGKIESLYRIEPLVDLISNNLDCVKLVAQPREFIATTTHIPSGKVEYFSTKDQDIQENPLLMLLAVLASCAIPAAFPPVPILRNGSHQLYIDGAFSRPLPIKKAIFEGCNTIIAIRCHSDKISKPMPRWAHQRILYGLGLTHNRGEKDEISLMKQELAINLFVIEPDFLPETLSTLSFAKGDMQKAIKEGERVAERELAPLVQYFKEQERSKAADETSAGEKKE